jgi:glucosamine--fructose-6-phosphate aminotransferase (isomerizing)
MCGIFGLYDLENKNIGYQLLKGISKLEYRGYDSLGIVTFDGKVYDLRKDIGDVNSANINLNFSEMLGFVGISHTRWATNGLVTRENAHPHHNKDKTIFAVHNGIIENYEEMKSNLEELGYEFLSATDTEVIPHYFDHKLKLGYDIKEIIKEFMNEVKGTFAILLLYESTIYALKRDSPLALGIDENKFYLSSDVYGFNDKTNKAIFFEDGEYATINFEGYKFYNSKNEIIEKEVKVLEKYEGDNNELDHDHYMIKEILEQPKVSKRVISSFNNVQKSNVSKIADLIRSKKKVDFLCCGTSYHASLVGVFLLKKVGIEARSIVASEWLNFVEPDEDTLIISISQSGETMDIVKPLKYAKEKGAKIVAITNSHLSTIERLSDVSINILAGQEVAVASTKAFTSTIITLMAISNALGNNTKLNSIPEKINEVLKLRYKCSQIANKLFENRDIYILGRHFSYPVAREIALKFKEVDYIHAEGMMAGELKHGTLALIEEGVPIISLIYNDCDSMNNSCSEIAARGGIIFKIGNKGDMDLKIPDCSEEEFVIYSTLIGHILSYEIGLLKGVEIDKCRNLAKSVTVL